jgi:tRNA A-37 threonylcarbamoyl transferase component Bud32
MLLEQSFIDQRKITEYKCENQFISKKNKVQLVRAFLEGDGEKCFVVKEYQGEDSSITREADMLTGLNEMGISVPRLYYRGERSIVMEYINGTILIDVLTDVESIAQESFDYINIKGIAAHIARWLDDFYKAAAQITGRDTILWDINLRNFLVGYKLYGIDFEDCREGAVEEDMGRLMAFIVTYEPAFTHFKMDFARQIYYALEKRVLLDKDRVMSEVEREFDAMRARRNIDIPKDTVKKIVL